MRTAALVTKGGTIDWLCLPDFDSDACFAALVGTNDNGRWTIAPTVPVTEVRRRYRKDTLILETDFITAKGTVRLIDFMPLRKGRQYSVVCRIIRCIDGTVPVRSELSPRLAFGRAVPGVTRADGSTKMYAGPDALFLRGGPDGGAAPHYGGTGLDASLLAIPMMGFLPATDPRVVGTVAALERELLQDGLLLRFKPEADVDGLVGDEGVFLACSFWLAITYKMMGREEDARRVFERAASTGNDLGLLAEEYDPKLQRQLGNFPQAFSHFALVNAALTLGKR